MLDFVMDVRETVVRLQGQRQRCIDIPRDDPPTALQSRAIQICETAFQASLAVEIARLTGRVRGNDNLMELFQGCIDSEPMTHAQLRQILKNVL